MLRTAAALPKNSKLALSACLSIHHNLPTLLGPTIPFLTKHRWVSALMPRNQLAISTRSTRAWLSRWLRRLPPCLLLRLKLDQGLRRRNPEMRRRKKVNNGIVTWNVPDHIRRLYEQLSKEFSMTIYEVATVTRAI